MINTRKFFYYSIAAFFSFAEIFSTEFFMQFTGDVLDLFHSEQKLDFPPIENKSFSSPILSELPEDSLPACSMISIEEHILDQTENLDFFVKNHLNTDSLKLVQSLEKNSGNLRNSMIPQHTQEISILDTKNIKKRILVKRPRRAQAIPKIFSCNAQGNLLNKKFIIDSVLKLHEFNALRETNVIHTLVLEANLQSRHFSLLINHLNSLPTIRKLTIDRRSKKGPVYPQIKKMNPSTVPSLKKLILLPLHLESLSLKSHVDMTPLLHQLIGNRVFFKDLKKLKLPVFHSDIAAQLQNLYPHLKIHFSKS